jgi:4-hydroxy-4-methyl-2-oxoglutarate aldolase
MDTVIVTNPPRAALEDVDVLAGLGVATIHEAMGRTGSAGPHLRPIQMDRRIAGTAVTVVAWPGDNLMLHAAVEQCQEGDLLVVTTTSPSTDGMFGELLATSLRTRGVRGLVIEAGVRDCAELREMDFPVWSAAVSAQGTVKATAGAVNVPVVVGRTMVRPGDVVVADDDGVVCVPRGSVTETIEAGRARVEKENATRRRFVEDGELGLDVYGLRPLLERLGVRYVSSQEYEAR